MTRTPLQRIALVATATGLAAVTALATTSTAFAAGTAVTGGHSTVTVSSTSAHALSSANISLHAVAPATYKNRVLSLPITGGTATPPTYVMHYAGAFTLVKGSKTFKVHGLVGNTNTNKVTALINSHSRMAVFTLGAPQSGSGGPGEVAFGAYTVKWTSGAQTYLDNHLSTKVFANHPKLGVGYTDVKFKA
jgi:hypothetical protein